MNKMKKALLLALSLALSAMLFTACGDNSDNSSSSSASSSNTESSESTDNGNSSDDDSSSTHEHAFTKLNKDTDGHWYECECGEKQTATAHIAGAEVKYDETNHWNECECGYKMNVTAHQFVDGKDETYHWVACDCGYEADQVAHEYTLAKSDETHHWYECICGATEEKTAHDYTIVKFDATNHWNECSCGAKSEVETHVAKEAWNTTDEEHWYECQACDYQMEKGAHEATGEWEFDDAHHWKECDDCAWHVEKTEHELVFGLKDGSYMWYCNVCDVESELAETITYFDRENKNILQANGTVKTNTNNYWDGASNVVSVSYANGVATLSYDPAKFTQEQAAVLGDGSIWVGYAIPVNGMDLTEYGLVLDVKMDNMNTTITAYAAMDYEGDKDAVYEVGVEKSFTVANAEDLGDGWYRYTISFDGTSNATKAADYIVLSLDNTASDVDKTKESVAYVKNVSLKKVTYYTVTVDGEAERVREGESVTLETPEKDGYEFLGWFDADGNEVNATFTPTKDIEISSQWNKLPIALSQGETTIDLSDLPLDIDYEEYSFSAGAGTYDVSITGGIKALAIVDGEITTEAITQFVFTEETTVIFAIAIGDELEMNGTITIAEDPTPADAIQVAERVIAVWGNILEDNGNLNGVTAPVGFSTVKRSVSGDGWTSALFPAQFYDRTDLTAYSDVWFALKIENAIIEAQYYEGNDIENESAKKSVWQEFDSWIYYHLTQTGTDAEGNALWSIEIKVGGQVIVMITEQSGETLSTNQPENTIARLLPDNGSNSADNSYVFIRHKGEGAQVSIYSTEILGVKKPYDPEISEAATQIMDKPIAVWGNILAENTDLNGETAPTGFTTVKRSDSGTGWTSGELSVNFYENTIDLSTYSEVWFALKAVNGYFNFVGGIAQLKTDSWIYFHLTQTGDKVWTIEITVNGVVYGTLTNQNGSTIKDLFYDNGSNSTDGGAIYLRRDSDGTTASLYLTEVLGLEKLYDPEISEDATQIMDKPIAVWGNILAENTDLNGETVPTGFTTVKRSDSGTGWTSGELSVNFYDST
ncbi:MAG: InlB B-repeat-containing protein, partial [Clostridia bacterium]|nr:InlB B-repeat-containing protein [Clostridia bacterium]